MKSCNKITYKLKTVAYIEHFIEICCSVTSLIATLWSELKKAISIAISVLFISYLISKWLVSSKVLQLLNFF